MRDEPHEAAAPAPGPAGTLLRILRIARHTWWPWRHVIVVLRNGHVIEEGSHDTLIAKGGLHAGLYGTNYASFDDVVAPEGADANGRGASG